MEQNGGPKHLAIIMDGNGRWARDRGLPRFRGHEEGAQSVRTITRECARLGLEELTLFAFSMENWKRPKTEIRFLMRLLKRFLIQERDEIRENNIRLRAIGRLDGLPGSVQSVLRESIELSRGNTGMVLRLALNYGGRGEIVDAARRIAEEVRGGRLDPASVDEKLFQKYLYDSSMTPPDLLIRTAGEFRISNFLLWEISYSEIFVTSQCWPQFREEDLEEALHAYGGRVRKFGGLEPTRC